jgi:hypothetical protein
MTVSARSHWRVSKVSPRHCYDITSTAVKLSIKKVWRTSTPEPTKGDGIIWTYLKDVTRYTPLFAKDGTLILQLDNLLTTGLDGQYASESGTSSWRLTIHS